MSNYEDFLATKVARPKPGGFEPVHLPKSLHPWQAEVVRWACRRGRAAIFAGCGLGKSLMQLAWADQVRERTGGGVLVLTPLAVGPQTVLEAQRFGIANVRLCESQADVSKGLICVTNYQKVIKDRFRPESFRGVVLDESSILKSYMGTTKRHLIDAFTDTEYRLCCTATPAPNDHMELGNHAEFLGVMESQEMLSRWFINRGDKVGVYRLKAHGEVDFWQWVASWAVCFDRPSDLGSYSDEGYVLPPLEWHEHIVNVDLSARQMSDASGQRLLVPADRLTATNLHAEMRLTVDARADRVAEAISSLDESWVVWCNTDYEADALTERLKGALEVRGSMPDRLKEERLKAFSEGRARVLITKPSIAGFGLNWQHCRNVAFIGLSYSHEQLYQAVRRCWRFGQANKVNAHVVLADTEGEVLAAIKRKEREHETMRTNMVKATREAIRGESSPELVRPARREAASESNCWRMLQGDCVEVLSDLEPDSIDFTIFSPPFAGLYIYSDALQDMGNCADDEEFLSHYRYLAPELLRVTVPGRLCAVHCKDLPRYAGRDGVAGLKDFPGRLISEHERAGWTYHSRVTIWKCPVTERERTNSNGLLHKSVTRDSSQIRQGMADYLLVFRKPPAEGDGLMSRKPIVRPEGLGEWVGDPAYDPRAAAKAKHPSRYARKKTPGNSSIALWQRYAEPVWWDIDQTDVLNESGSGDSRDERHICPLQIGLIRRAIYLWSAPGDLVLSPFAGIGSEGVGSLLEHRRFLGVELKPAYFDQAVRNLKTAEEKSRQRGLFDNLEEYA